MNQRYEMLFHGRNRRVFRLYQGDSDKVMYQHVTTIEIILMDGYGSGEIEIIENGESRWIEYRDGLRLGIGKWDSEEVLDLNRIGGGAGA